MKRLMIASLLVIAGIVGLYLSADAQVFVDGSRRNDGVCQLERYNVGTTLTAGEAIAVNRFSTGSICVPAGTTTMSVYCVYDLYDTAGWWVPAWHPFNDVPWVDQPVTDSRAQNLTPVMQASPWIAITFDTPGEAIVCFYQR